MSPLPLLLVSLLAPAPDAGRARHELRVTLDPAAHRVAVEDRLTLPPGEGPVELLLHGALRVTRSEPPLVEVPLGEIAPFFSINGMERAAAARVPLRRWRAARPAAGAPLVLAYEGAIDHPLGAPREEYTRGFRETAGQVGPEGVYLAGSTFWVPYLGPDLVEFELRAAAPGGWHLVAAGEGTSRDEAGEARWSMRAPVDEVVLVGGPLERSGEPVPGAGERGAVEALVYLRARDDALAGRYLAATGQYLRLYGELVGPYPYAKFALVENFWETGYGMPSFTLLGPAVIRFPFILHSSYPHEILHNWWGNSVFVDFAGGNWCEGLTAYLADHLVQEQRGRGAEHRRATLQKYRDYVREGRDFPLAEFRGRESAATEAVGYGKALMAFHMLRGHVGDERFRDWLRRVYRAHRGRRASFADLRREAEAVAGEELGWLLAPLVEKTGAPEPRLAVEGVARDGEEHVVRAAIALREGERLEVPLVLQTEAGALREVVVAGGPRTPVVLRAAARPLALHLDPEFDLFRRLDPRETPASVGRVFGEPRALALLPADASDEERARYRALAEGWASESHQVEVKLDREVAALPGDRAVWLLGRANRHAAALLAALPGASVGGEELRVAGERLPLAGRSFVLVGGHPADPARAVGWIAVDPAGAVPGLGRKLPHYGRYSYLGFEGEEPVNVLKGEWPATDSPLVHDLRPEGERGAPLSALRLPPRRALAELPPVFSAERLAEDVRLLSAPELEGRGPGSAGLERAARYVEERFREMGLAAPAADGSYRQDVRLERCEGGAPCEAANVIGVLPGSRPEWKEQSVVVCAHLDGLGRGFPEAHAGDEGRVHPGADDNASGVALLLELARAYAGGERPGRTLVLAAFTGEEAGRWGSRHWVEHPLPGPLPGVRAAVNLDTVGRLGGGKVQVLSTASADEWPHVFRGVGFVTGIEAAFPPQGGEASDHVSFLEKGIPAVQVFTGAHADWHRPGDTADKVDVPGLVKVATFVKEAVDYLLERPEPLTSRVTAAGAAAPAPAPAPGGRRVSLGTVPDFGFPGPGVRVDQVLPGSPAEKAGIAAGDVLVALDGTAVGSLREFSDRLKGYEPGRTVRATVSRGGAERTVEVTLVAR